MMYVLTKILTDFSDERMTVAQYLGTSLMLWVVNGVVLGMLLARIFVFGEPVTKPLSEPSVAYWRQRKQADINWTRVHKYSTVMSGHIYFLLNPNMLFV